MKTAFGRELKMQQMQIKCQKVSRLQELMTEQDKVIISTIKDDIKARTEETFFISNQLSLRQTELDQ